MRGLSPPLSCEYESTLLQTRFDSGGFGMGGAAVTLVDHFDGSLKGLWRGQPLAILV